jgi:FGGY-family pentulose kinase
MDTNDFVIGVDVGTGSVRAGLFSIDGKLISSSSHPIKMWKPKPNFVEQSSEDIWQSCCKSIKAVLEESDVKPSKIIGIGFDATCSLVAIDSKNRPVSLSSSKSTEQNVIVWMDHRAKAEVEEINKTQHAVLKYVGGTISPEMQTPKLLWIKRNLPDAWSSTAKFFDLSDYLVYRATGYDVRSICTTTCKWTYQGHQSLPTGNSIGSWDSSYFKEIGLSDLVDEGFQRIGTVVRPVGEQVGTGLTESSAKELGLISGTAVGVSIIDAHAGGLGLIGCNIDGDVNMINDRLVLVGGTSSCHLAVSDTPNFVQGVWGPYYSALVPELWMAEGGQSSTGSLIDHIIFNSSQSTTLVALAEKKKITVYDFLNERLEILKSNSGLATLSQLTANTHVLPYFMGNRSPRANPNLTGSLLGLKLSSTIDDLALLYLATIQAIAFGTKHIIEALNSSGYSISTILATGGGIKNEVFITEHSNITGCRIILAEEPEAVLLGSAMIGAVAGKYYDSLKEAMAKMSKTGRIIKPDLSLKDYYEKKYVVFHKMFDDDIKYKSLMKDYLY